MDSFWMPNFGGCEDSNDGCRRTTNSTQAQRAFAMQPGLVQSESSNHYAPAMYQMHPPSFPAFEENSYNESHPVNSIPADWQTGLIGSDQRDLSANPFPIHDALVATHPAQMTSQPRNIALAITPPQRAPDQPRAAFLAEAPDYPYPMSRESPPLRFTLAEIIAITVNWFSNQHFAFRFMNNGLTSAIHVAILQEHRHIPLSDAAAGRVKDNVSDRYRKTMRKILDDWSKSTHKTPADWDRRDLTVNNFIPDVAKVPNWTVPSSVPFKELYKGMKKLPTGADAGDLTRALDFAMKNSKPASNGKQEEFMFPDDLHVILSEIGYTKISPAHYDNAVIARYKALIKTLNSASNKRKRELEKAGLLAPPQKRRHIKKSIDPIANIEIPKQMTATLAQSLSSELQTPETHMHQTTQPTLAAAPTNFVPPPMYRTAMQIPNPSQTHPRRQTVPSPLPTMSATVPTLPSQWAQPSLASQAFLPAQHSPNIALDITATQACSVDVPEVGIEAPSSIDKDDISNSLAWVNPFEQAGRPTLVPFSEEESAEHARLCDDARRRADCPLASNDGGWASPQRQELSSSELSGLGNSHVQPQGENVDIGAEMDALLEQHQGIDYSDMLYSSPDIDIPFVAQADPLADALSISLWPQYQSTQLLKDCVEGDDPNDHSELARAARWCRNPANNGGEYCIGQVWFVLGLEEMLAQEDQSAQEMSAMGNGQM